MSITMIGLDIAKEVYHAKGAAGASPADPAGGAERRDGKGCGRGSPGNTERKVVLRARPADWCLARKRTPMMASGMRRATGRT